jgi:hypothetical protein
LELEAELILDYIEKFNDLFDHDKIIEAAYFAAASPKNVLRDIETLYRFKSKPRLFRFNIRYRHKRDFDLNFRFKQ